MKRQSCKKCNITCYEATRCPKCGAGDLVTVTEAELMESSTHELAEALKEHYTALGMTEADAARAAGIEADAVIATDLNALDFKNIGDQF
jgi:hypothetical protein